MPKENLRPFAHHYPQLQDHRKACEVHIPMPGLLTATAHETASHRPEASMKWLE